MNLGLGNVWSAISEQGYTKMFYFEGGWSDPNNFFKQFISGALIAVVMTGLDQDMMQKNLTSKSLRDAQKNVFTFSFILIFANILFLTLGGMLYIYAAQSGIVAPERTDLLYPEIAINNLGPTIGIVFILGLIAAAYSSADSALTALTTSFCIDFLDFEKRELTEAQKKKMRLITHISFSLLLLVVIIVFKALNNDAIINKPLHMVRLYLRAHSRIIRIWHIIQTAHYRPLCHDRLYCSSCHFLYPRYKFSGVV